MKRIVAASFAVLFTIILAGCGGGDGGPTLVAQDIYSSRSLDGDITLDNNVLLTLTPATQFDSVEAGFDAGFPPAVPPRERRAFLVFDLSTIPLNASIQRAFVSIFVSKVDDLGIPVQDFPFFVDLIDTRPTAFPLPLRTSYFDAPFLDNTSFTFIRGDQNQFVDIPVTALMKTAQATKQPLFEVRLTPTGLEEGIITITDSTLLNTAPLLHVEYF